MMRLLAREAVASREPLGRGGAARAQEPQRDALEPGVGGQRGVVHRIRGRNPCAPPAAEIRLGDAALGAQRLDQRVGVGDAARDDLLAREVAEIVEDGRQLVGVTGTAVGRGFLQLGLHTGDHFRVERTRRHRPGLAHRDGVAAPLLRVAGVEIRPVPGEQQGIDERRGQRRVNVACPHLLVVQATQNPLEARHVERVLEALAQRLGDDGKVRQAADGLEQRIRLQAHQVRGRALSFICARDEQRAHGGVAEACAEQRRADQRVAEEIVDFLRRHQRGEPLGADRRDLAGRERQQQPVVHVRGLGHQAVRAAHLFFQRHAPGAVDAHAEDGMDHRVAPAHLVGERLHDDALIVRHAVEDLAGLHEPRAQRRRRARLQPALAFCPIGEVGIVDAPGRIAAQPSDGQAEIERARGMLALPERDGRRHAVRVLDQHAVRAHLDDLPRVRAEQEDVARQ